MTTKNCDASPTAVMERFEADLQLLHTHNTLEGQRSARWNAHHLALTELRELIEREVIGYHNLQHATYCDMNGKWENMEDVHCSCQVVPNNELRAEQRAALNRLFKQGE